MQISLMVEGQTGLTWDRWQALVARVEQWGFAGLYRSDHFTMTTPPNYDALETIVSLTYAADHTKNIHLGPLVAPFSFRDPVMLARQAAHIDALSAGRMILGVGAGWMQREHDMFGYPLLEKRARMERFAEGLHVVWSLLKSSEPVTFQGHWYTLQDAEILPRPFKTKILVGGNGPNKTLPLAAKYADVWNGVALTPQRFQELGAALDRFIYDAGRETSAVKKTTSAFLYFGRDSADLEQRVAPFREGSSELRDLPLDGLVSAVRERNTSVIGLAADVIPQIQAYADAGVEELMLQILRSDAVQWLDAFAAQVLPHFAARGQANA